MSTSLTLCNQIFEFQNYGNAFLLLRANKNQKVFAIGEAIYHRQFSFIEEVISTEVEICIKLKSGFTKANIESLKTVRLPKTTKGNLYEIPVWFNDTEDWLAVSSHCNQSKNQIIKRLQTIEFNIAMFGFLPGFVYLNGLPKELNVPRKYSPSIKVKPNTLAIGGPYLGIYSLPSPGGWHAIGEIACNVFDKDQTPPMLVSNSDCFKLKSIDKEKFLGFKSQQLSITELK